MRIKMRTLKAGPGGVVQPDQVVNVSREEAQRLVEGGFAEYVDRPRKPARRETTTAGPPERTVQPEPSRRPAGPSEEEVDSPDEDASPEAIPALEDMTVEELSELAQELGIEGRSGMRKAELIEALRADIETDNIDDEDVE